MFYAFQLSWSADQQMQAFGRVHRSNQTSAPVIRLVLLDLAGQKRLVNAVSKRLAALGALIKGERHSLSSELFRPEDVTDQFGKAALARPYRQIESGRHGEAGFGLRDLDRMGVLNKEKTAVRDSYRPPAPEAIVWPAAAADAALGGFAPKPPPGAPPLDPGLFPSVGQLECKPEWNKLTLDLVP